MRMLVGVMAAVAVAWPAVAEVTVGAFSPAMARDARATAQLARTELNKALFDYPSARFRDVRAIITVKNSTRFCGFVNGKNRMGAYTGWKEFLFSDGSGLSVYPDSDILIETVCHGGLGTQDTRDWSADLTFR